MSISFWSQKLDYHHTRPASHTYMGQLFDGQLIESKSKVRVDSLYTCDQLSHRVFELSVDLIVHKNNSGVQVSLYGALSTIKTHDFKPKMPLRKAVIMAHAVFARVAKDSGS